MDTLLTCTRQSALADSFELLVQQLPDAMLVLQDGRLIFANPAGLQMLGAESIGEISGLPIEKFISPDHAPQVRARIEHMLASGVLMPVMEHCITKRNGTVIDVESSMVPLVCNGQAVLQMTMRDIGARKQAESLLRSSEQRFRSEAGKADHARAMLHHEKTILEMIALDRPRDDVLQQICVLAESLLQSDLRCAVLLFDAHRACVRVAAASSLPGLPLQTFHVGGLPGNAAIDRSGTRFDTDCAATAANPLEAAYRMLGLESGLYACDAVPIRSAGDTAIAAFAVYCTSARPLSADELTLISDVSYLAGIAIRKDHVERSLEESQDRYRAVVTCLTEGIIVQSRDGRVLAHNPSAERILRMGDGGLNDVRRGSHVKRYLDENNVDIPFDELPSQIVFRTGAPILDFIVGLELSDGDVIWIAENVLPVRRHDEAETTSIVISFTDISATKAAQQRLKFMATHDVLTGLPNRAFFTGRLNEVLAQAATRTGERRALMFLDLDRFNTINDSLGHEAGDRLLKVVANRLSSCIREQDMLARLGGDEFVILTGAIEDLPSISGLCDRILKSLSEALSFDGNEYFIGASIGIAMFPEHGQDSATLLRSADTAMYHAKERGRNNYQFFSTELNERAQRRYLLEKNLRRALAHHEFELYYQPKIDMCSGRIVGAEALLRWHDENGIAVPPSEFIPVAEETGLIVAIGKWALELACRQAALWRRHLSPELTIAVNLSPRQFQDDRIVMAVKDILLRTGIDARALELEITESLLLGDTDKLAPTFDALTREGISFAIDDFGTGYSSLAYLQRFPIATLKVDRSFINDLPHSRDANALAQAIIAMARALDLRVIAEGVEHEQQMSYLRHAGCHEVQGFYVSKPLPSDDFEHLLWQQNQQQKS